MMSTVLLTPIALPMALLLDWLLGDPPRFPHPVRGLGALISASERISRRALPNPFLAGALTVLVTVAVAFGVVWGTLYLSRLVSPWLAAAVELLWLYLGLAARGLADAGHGIREALERKDLDSARQALSGIVGRDTDRLDGAGVSRACIESVAENTVDGILSPLFFALVGGAPLLWAFKAVSTCDSMIGYKDERYIRFGTVGARLDDAANFLPARLALVLFPFASALCGGAPAASWKTALRDRRLHASPNAGIPEAAMAGALGVRLGGPAWYGGELEPKPFFGAEFPDPGAGDIRRAIRILWALTWLFLSLGILVAILARFPGYETLHPFPPSFPFQGDPWLSSSS